MMTFWEKVGLIICGDLPAVITEAEKRGAMKEREQWETKPLWSEDKDGVYTIYGDFVTLEPEPSFDVDKVRQLIMEYGYERSFINHTALLKELHIDN